MKNKEATRRFAVTLLDEIADAMFFKIRGLSDHDLKKVAAANQRASTTNCSWIRFAVKGAVFTFIEEELRNREVIKRRADKRESAK